MELTHDAEKLLCLMYKTYLDKRKLNSSKTECNSFGSTRDIHKNLLPDQDFSDVSELIWELSRNELISGSCYDNILYNIALTSHGIIYMENRFKNNVKEIVSFISNFS